jgi:nicotinamide riboside kinase
LKKRKHIVFTGPESSGKTTLAKVFSKSKDVFLVTEYARKYLANKKSYVKADLLEIAKEQQITIDLALKSNTKLVVSDTDLLTIKIWSEFKYNECDSWIKLNLLKNLPDLYVLCKPDFPWQEDPLRENPNDRNELYNLYLTEIKKLNIPFIEVGGSLEERLSEILKL